MLKGEYWAPPFPMEICFWGGSRMVRWFFNLTFTNVNGEWQTAKQLAGGGVAVLREPRHGSDRSSEQRSGQRLVFQWTPTPERYQNLFFWDKLGQTKTGFRVVVVVHANTCKFKMG